MFFPAPYSKINPCFTAGKQTGVRDCHATRGRWRRTISTSIVCGPGAVYCTVSVPYRQHVDVLAHVSSAKILGVRGRTPWHFLPEKTVSNQIDARWCHQMDEKSTSLRCLTGQTATVPEIIFRFRRSCFLMGVLWK